MENKDGGVADGPVLGCPGVIFVGQHVTTEDPPWGGWGSREESSYLARVENRW